MGDKKFSGFPVCVRIAHHLADHDGVITGQEAYDLGMTADQVQHKVALGLWLPHARGVYLSAEHRMTDMARLRIAVAAYGGVVDRSAAAWLYGLIPDLPDVITVSVPRSAHGRGGCAFEVQVKRRTFPSEDVTSVEGLQVIGIPLALLQTASILGPQPAVRIIDRAMQTSLSTPRALRECLDRNSGAHGMKLARILVEAAEDPSESYLERLFVRILKRHGIVGWVQQVWINGRRIDFVWPELGIAVSINGWAFHRYQDRWHQDQKTANMLLAMGLYPLSFDWERLRWDEENAVAELVDAIEKRQEAA